MQANIRKTKRLPRPGSLFRLHLETVGELHLVCCAFAYSQMTEKLCVGRFDSGSNTIFIKRDVADELGIKGPEHIFSVNTLGGSASHDEMCVDFLLATEDGSKSVDVRRIHHSVIEDSRSI